MSSLFFFESSSVEVAKLKMTGIVSLDKINPDPLIICTQSTLSITNLYASNFESRLLLGNSESVIVIESSKV